MPDINPSTDMKLFSTLCLGLLIAACSEKEKDLEIENTSYSNFTEEAHGSSPDAVAKVTAYEESISAYKEQSEFWIEESVGMPDGNGVVVSYKIDPTDPKPPEIPWNKIKPDLYTGPAPERGYRKMIYYQLTDGFPRRVAEEIVQREPLKKNPSPKMDEHNQSP